MLKAGEGTGFWTFSVTYVLIAPRVFPHFSI